MKSGDNDLFQKGPQIHYKEEVPQIDVEEFKKVIHSRRSVRIYDENEPIPESVVEDCLDMALLAPNSSNLQCWEFLWIKTPEIKEKVVHACFSQLAAKTAQELIVAVARTGTWKRNNQQILDYFQSRSRATPPQVLHYYQKLIPFMMTQGPLSLFGLGKKIFFYFAGLFKVVPRSPVSKNDLKVWAQKTTALACENLMLAFRAHGFDTCPMEGYDANRLRKILKLPRDAELCMVISAGKRKEGGVYGRRFRLPKEQFIKKI